MNQSDPVGFAYLQHGKLTVVDLWGKYERLPQGLYVSNSDAYSGPGNIDADEFFTLCSLSFASSPGMKGRTGLFMNCSGLTFKKLEGKVTNGNWR